MAFIIFPEESVLDTKNLSCFLIQDKNLFLKKDGTKLSFDELKKFHDDFKDGMFFAEKETGLCAVDLPPELNSRAEKYGFVPMSIREYFSLHAEEENMKAARAKSILEWLKSMNFCPKCASHLELDKKFSALFCPSCKKQYFPRIEPAVIVLVHKGDEVLLARHTYRNQDTFVCIAGFIEGGENAEHAVFREVLEETGIKVKNIKYKGSQSWPFPDQLMLAFEAEYEGGEIKVQKEEISEARWFNKNSIPEGLKQGSVAWRLVYNKF